MTNESKYNPDNLIKIPVGQVKIGMFVAQLDRPWTGTPFLLQGFTVRTLEDIRKLSEHCNHVFVVKNVARPKDRVTFSRASRLPPEKQTELEKSDLTRRSQQRRKKPVVRNRPAYENSVSLKEEFPIARQCHLGAKQVLHKAFDAARSSQPLDVLSLKKIVADFIDSILRNPDALLWMTNIRHRDEYFVEHGLNVCIRSLIFGRHLRYNKEELQGLGLSSLLLDVGMVRMSDELLSKSESLTDEERKVVRGHTLEGAGFLKQQEGVSEEVISTVFSHHERVDGSGYPRGFQGDQIPEYARLVAIVDAYDAMISNRSYSAAKSPAEAARTIFASRGKEFDEDLAQQFMQAFGPYPPGTLVELHNGMVGISTAVKGRLRHLPAVVVMRDENKQPMSPFTLELHLTDTGELGKAYLIKTVHRDGDFDISLENFQLDKWV